MKILISYEHFPNCTTAEEMAEAFGSLAETPLLIKNKPQGPGSVDWDIAAWYFNQNRQFDLFVYIESGLSSYFPRGIERLPVPTACYLTDPHIDLDRRLFAAKFFDMTFLAQKDYLKFFQEQGSWTQWLPVAFNPNLINPDPGPKIYDIGFVGSTQPRYRRRNLLLKTLANRFKINDFSKTCDIRETIKIYQQSRIVFNCSVSGDLTLRVFEALGSGSLLVTDASANGLLDLFTDKTHLLTYVGEEDLLKIADYFISHEQEREKIAIIGAREAHAKHTYICRAKAVLASLDTIRRDGTKAQARQASSEKLRRWRSEIYAGMGSATALFRQSPEGLAVLSRRLKSKLTSQ